MTYKVLGWDRDDAKLKSFSLATRAKGGTKLVIELEVTAPYALAHLLGSLEDIKREQEDAAREQAAEMRSAARREAASARRPSPKALGARAMPLLTYRGDDHD